MTSPDVPKPLPDMAEKMADASFGRGAYGVRQPGSGAHLDAHLDRHSSAYSDVPSTEGFIALLEAFRATGGTAPGAMVARLLEEHQSGHSVSLAKRVFTHQLFGFDWRANFWIPMFQFRAHDLSVKPTAQLVRAALPAGWSGWTVACWFAAPNLQLDGSSPVDALDGDFDAVLQAASLGESSEASRAGRWQLASDAPPAWAGPPLWRERRAHVRL